MTEHDPRQVMFSLTSNQTITLSNALREAYSIAVEHLGNCPLGPAIVSARDAIDSGVIPPEICAEVFLGKTPIETALRDAAEVLMDLVNDPEFLQERPSNQIFVDALRQAADTFRNAGV